MAEYAIEVENLSKTYLLNFQFKENLLENLSGKLKHKKTGAQKVHGLNNVSFKVKKGEVLGIIGDNGSGKSTLLKILSSVTKPTSGEVKIDGKLVGILEVGTGLHPELSGRDNIYFSGSLLGLSKEKIQEVEQKIIDFSGLNEFINVQVKFYSSGMFMRLAFSIIANIDADILLLDEVFSVGDSSFRQKCEDHIEKLYKSGKTILLVSHDMSSISKICTQYLHLDNGVIIKKSEEIGIIAEYISKQYEKSNTIEEEEEDPIEVEEEEDQVETHLQMTKEKPKAYEQAISEKGELVTIIKNAKEEYLEDDLMIKCYSNSKKAQWDNLDEIYIECAYTQKTNNFIFPVFALNYQASNTIAALSPFNSEQLVKDSYFKRSGNKKLKCSIPNCYLNAGFFSVNLFFTNENSEHLFVFREVISFVLTVNQEFCKKTHYDGKYTGPFLPKLKWEISHENS